MDLAWVGLNSLDPCSMKWLSVSGKYFRNVRGTLVITFRNSIGTLENFLGMLEGLWQVPLGMVEGL